MPDSASLIDEWVEDLLSLLRHDHRWQNLAEGLTGAGNDAGDRPRPPPYKVVLLLKSLKTDIFIYSGPPYTP